MRYSIAGHAVAKVIKSKAGRFPEGSHIYGVLRKPLRPPECGLEFALVDIQLAL